MLVKHLAALPAKLNQLSVHISRTSAMRACLRCVQLCNLAFGSVRVHRVILANGTGYLIRARGANRALLTT